MSVLMSNKTRKKLGAYGFEDENFEFSDYKVRKLSKDRYYQGEYDSDDNEITGSGALAYPDGSLYEGIDGGPGRLIHSNGDYYEGEWRDGEAEGEGTFTKVDGQTYKGEWIDDK